MFLHGTNGMDALEKLLNEMLKVENILPEGCIKKKHRGIYLRLCDTEQPVSSSVSMELTSGSRKRGKYFIFSVIIIQH